MYGWVECSDRARRRFQGRDGSDGSDESDGRVGSVRDRRRNRRTRSTQRSVNFSRTNAELIAIAIGTRISNPTTTGLLLLIAKIEAMVHSRKMSEELKEKRLREADGFVL